MKKIFLLFFILLNFSVFSQEYFSGCVVYNKSLTFKSKKDSLSYLEYTKDLPHDFLNFTLPTELEKYFVKKDSVLKLEHLKKINPVYLMYLVTKEKIVRVDAISGRCVNWQGCASEFKVDFKKLKRNSEGDCEILGRKCTAWNLKSKKFKQKIWLTKISEKARRDLNVDIFMGNQLIMKQVVEYDDGRVVCKQVNELTNECSLDFDKMLKELSQTDINSMYHPIAKNSVYKRKAIKENEILPDLYYRNVFDSGLGHLDQLTKKSKYTIIELWGTWCLPCLVATEKIKKLRKQYSEEQLSVLSLNSNDKTEKKVKKMITMKKMNWNHAYSTEKLNFILNSQNIFPKMIVLNSENKVLFIGNPNTDIDQVQKILEN